MAHVWVVERQWVKCGSVPASSWRVSFHFTTRKEAKDKCKQLNKRYSMVKYRVRKYARVDE